MKHSRSVTTIGKEKGRGAWQQATFNKETQIFVSVNIKQFPVNYIS